MPRWTFSGGTFPPYCRHFRRSGAAEAVGAGRLRRRRRARFHKIPVRGGFLPAQSRPKWRENKHVKQPCQGAPEQERLAFAKEHHRHSRRRSAGCLRRKQAPCQRQQETLNAFPSSSRRGSAEGWGDSGEDPGAFPPSVRTQAFRFAEGCLQREGKTGTITRRGALPLSIWRGSVCGSWEESGRTATGLCGGAG